MAASSSIYGVPVLTETLQSLATTGNGVEVPLMGAWQHVTLYLKWSSGVSAGVVTIETADAVGYAGTWGAVIAVTQTGASREDTVQMEGPFNAVRARISTTVVGGTVTVTMVARP